MIHSGSDTQKAELSDLAAKCAAAKQSGDSAALQSLESRGSEGSEGQPTHFVFSPSEIFTLNAMFRRHIPRPFRPYPPENRLKQQLQKFLNPFVRRRGRSYGRGGNQPLPHPVIAGG